MKQILSEQEILLAARDVVHSLSKGAMDVVSLEKKRTDRLEQTFLSTLPYLGSFQSEGPLLEALLRDKMGIKEFHLRKFPERFRGINIYGVFVTGRDELIYVIKTMGVKTSELARELVSRQIFNGFGLLESVVCSVEALGKYDFVPSGEMHTFFVQRAAKGESLSFLMREVERSQGEERAVKLNTFEKALTKAAVALAELHLKQANIKTPVGKETIIFNLGELRTHYKLVAEEIQKGFSIGLTQEQLEGIYEHVIEAVVGNWGMSGYSHGDAHLENLFFDSSTDQFTWIDTPSFLSSVDAEGHPIGFPPYDFAWIWCNIGSLAAYTGLSSQQGAFLQGVFKTEYERLMGENLSPLPARQLALLSRQLYFIGNICLKEEVVSNDPESKELLVRLKRIRDSAVREVVLVC